MGGADTLSRMRVKNGDLVVAALAAVLAIMHTGVLFSDWAGAADWAQAVLSWGFVGALAVWRSHPRWSAALMVGLNAAWSALWILAPVNIGYTLWVVLVPLGVFTARRWCSTPFSRGVSAAALVWSFASPFMWTWGEDFILYYRTPVDAVISLALHWAAIAVAFLFAKNLVAEQAARANEARMREQLLVTARDEERRETAREIHDVLGHTLTLIKVQANAGLAGGHEREALQTIQAAAGDALADIRGLVRDLREENAGLQPAPGLRDIPELVERFRDAGLNVTLDLSAVSVPAVTGLAAHRIVAESVTNAAKHQVDPVVHVTVEPAEGGVAVAVVSTGRRAPQPGAGAGIEGMRERARATGGTLDVTYDGDTVTVNARLGV